MRICDHCNAAQTKLYAAIHEKLYLVHVRDYDRIDAARKTTRLADS